MKNKINKLSLESTDPDSSSIGKKLNNEICRPYLYYASPYVRRLTINNNSRERAGGGVIIFGGALFISRRTVADASPLLRGASNSRNFTVVIS